MEALRPILERLWQQMLELDDLIVEEEVAPDLLLEKSKIKLDQSGAPSALVGRSENDKKLTAAGNARREDLLVYFGLNLFNGRTRYSTLAPELQRDIKAFLGNTKAAVEVGEIYCFPLETLRVIDETAEQQAPVA